MCYVQVILHSLTTASIQIMNLICQQFIVSIEAMGVWTMGQSIQPENYMLLKSVKLRSLEPERGIPGYIYS
jgi:hypothetical protein